MNCTRKCAFALVLALVASSLVEHSMARAQDVAKSDGPRIVFSTQLAVSAGETVTLQLRGLKLDTAERVEVTGDAAGIEVAIKKKEKSSPPNQMTPQQAGDTLVEIELKIPDGFTAEAIPLVAHTPEGATEPYRLLQIAKDQLTAEAEPNNGFNEPQPLEPGKTIQGVIQLKDPDVFQLSAKAGQKLTAEVVAARQGSPLDGILTLYDSAGHLLETIDDTAESTDPILTFTVPKDGNYFLVLQDAQDRGGPTHPYLLRARVE